MVGAPKILLPGPWNVAERVEGIGWQWGQEQKDCKEGSSNRDVWSWGFGLVWGAALKKQKWTGGKQTGQVSPIEAHAHHLFPGPQAHRVCRYTASYRSWGREAFQKGIRRLLEQLHIFAILIMVIEMGGGGGTRQRQRMWEWRFRRFSYESSLLTYKLCRVTQHFF